MKRVIVVGAMVCLGCSSGSHSATDARKADSALPLSTGGAGGAIADAPFVRTDGIADSVPDIAGGAISDAWAAETGQDVLDAPSVGTGGSAGGASGRDGGGGEANVAGRGGSTGDAGGVAATGGRATGGTGGGGQGGSSTVCGNGLCERNEIARSCPDDCARTFNDVGVDLSVALMWQLGSSTFMVWDDAAAYCSNLELDGYTDWRMPTYREQEDILGNCAKNMDGDTFCSPCKSSPLCKIWFPRDELTMWNSFEYSSTTAGGVNFSSGQVVYSWYKSNFIKVRCVRNLVACTADAQCLGNEACANGHCVPTWFAYDGGAPEPGRRDSAVNDTAGYDTSPID